MFILLVLLEVDFRVATILTNGVLSVGERTGNAAVTHRDNVVTSQDEVRWFMNL